VDDPAGGGGAGIYFGTLYVLGMRVRDRATNL